MSKTNNKEGQAIREHFEEWIKLAQELSADFEQYAQLMKQTILKGNLDEQSKEQFEVCFDYVMSLYKDGKPLDINQLKIYLEQIKGYKNIKMTEVINIMLLLSFCGFSFDEN